MAMSKKDFIALADAIRESAATGQGQLASEVVLWSRNHLRVLADFMHTQNPRFNENRWFGYLYGECGPNGGSVKKSKVAA